VFGLLALFVVAGLVLLLYVVRRRQKRRKTPPSSGTIDPTARFVMEARERELGDLAHVYTNPLDELEDLDGRVTETGFVFSDGDPGEAAPPITAEARCLGT
jgi:hypothetical protein